MVLNLIINEHNVTVTYLKIPMKRNTGRTLVQSRCLIVSISMFIRLPIVNKADITRLFSMEINRSKICMRSNHTRIDIQSFIFLVVKRLGIIEERSICTSGAIKFRLYAGNTILGQQLTWVTNHQYKCSEIWDDDKLHSSQFRRQGE